MINVIKGIIILPLQGEKSIIDNKPGRRSLGSLYPGLSYDGPSGRLWQAPRVDKINFA